MEDADDQVLPPEQRDARPRPPVEGDPPTDGRRGHQPPRDIEQAAETAEPRASIRRRDLKAVRDAADDLLDELHEVQNGDLVADIIKTGLKLLRDETNRGDVKLIESSFRELRYALRVFAPYRDTRKVSIFGSARTPVEHPDYRAAEAVGRAMAAAGWMVITGAGPGIMAAGHGGAGAKGSFGLNISLPFEQAANPHIHGDPKLVDFKYFFTRKLMFVRSSHAVVLLPGGFGTMDEGFEVMTLIQTGKCPPMPLVMLDHDGSGYWRAFDDYVRGHLLKGGLISEQDLSLYTLTQDAAEAATLCRDFYGNYHSLRYTRDLLIIRLQRDLTERQFDAVRDEFADLGQPNHPERIWRHGGPLKCERNERKLRHLHRLVFPFNRRDHGRLRQLIDHLNALPSG